MAKKKRAKPSMRDVTPRAVNDERLSMRIVRMMVVIVPLAIANLKFKGAASGAFLANQVTMPKALLLFAFTGLAFGAVLFDVSKGRLVLRRTRFDLALLTVLALMIATIPFSVYWQQAVFGSYARLEGLLTYVMYALLFWIGATVVRGSADMRMLVRSATYTAGGIALYALLQALDADPIAWNVIWESGRVFGTYGNPQLFAGYLALMLPLATSNFLSEKDTVRRNLSLACAVAVGLSLVFTYSRAGWLAGLIGLTVILWVARYRDHVSRRELGFGVGAVVAVIAGIGLATMASSNAVTSVFARLTSVFDTSSGSLASRGLITRAAIDAIGQRPFTGWGIDSFGLIWQRVAPVEYLQQFGWTASADNAHNWLLQTAATMGIPVALALTALIAWILVAGARPVFEKDATPSRLLYTGAWASCIALLVHLQAGISEPGVTFLMWLLLGALSGPVAAEWSVRLSQRRALIIGAVPLIGALVFAGSLAIADNAALASRSASPSEQVSALTRATTVAPWVLDYRMDLSMAERLVAAESEPGSAFAFSALQSSEQGYRRLAEQAPGMPQPLIELVGVYNVGVTLTGEPQYAQLAVSTADEALNIAPNHPLLLVRAAIARANSGDAAGADELLDWAIQLDPKYSEPWIVRYRIRLAQGDDVQVRVLAEEMVERFPDDKAVGEALGNRK